MRVGVDTGGTFTDCVILAQGEVKILKVFSTPEDASRGILEGVRRLAHSFQAGGPLEIIHGTTVGTNSLLERRGARVALLTTEGFEDLFEIGRQARPRLYDLEAQQAPPLVPRGLRFGVRERTTADGTILQRPSAAGIARLTSRLKRLHAESIAVCFLFSYLNPANERVVARALKRLRLPVSVSHEILPEFREYERLATVVINAFLAPRMGEYLRRLERGVEEDLRKRTASSNSVGGPNRVWPRGGPRPVLSKLPEDASAHSGSAASACGKPPAFRAVPHPPFSTAQAGRLSLPACAVGFFHGGRLSERRSLSAHRAAEPQFTGARSERNWGERRSPLPGGKAPSRVYVMQSSGGITTAARAAHEPVRTILSGPAGGVVASTWLAQQLGLSRAISFDMGGTSTDVSLIDGLPRTTNETTLGGLPVAVPVLDVHSVGAGGGSLARLDAGGALRVGPESAGAKPGPICYRLGGTQPTVTDANLLLGRLDPDHFLGGEFQLDLRAAEQGFRDFLRRHSEKIGFKTVPELAADIVAVSNATMEKALRVISVERGHDPREFALICFGGGGGLHAADLARSLRLPKVVVPRNPGAFSALGILLSDVVKDSVQSVLLPVPDGGRHSAQRSADFWLDLKSRFAILERASRAELQREGFPAERARVERRLDLRYAGQSYELSVPFRTDFRELFHRQHEKAYGYAHPGRLLEIVNVRLRLTIPTPKPQLRARRAGNPDSARARLKTKPVWFAGRFHPTRLYDRERLGAGARFGGPAVVVEYSSTTVVPPDFDCCVDEYLNLILCQRRMKSAVGATRRVAPAPTCSQ
jgi:N-methylhydantoinase A/oxoprolinase/acetone carboxylase beta subunit